MVQNRKNEPVMTRTKDDDRKSVMPLAWFQATSYASPIDTYFQATELRPLAPGERRIGGLIIPPFQRGAVWTLEQKIKLIESLWAGLPVGSLVINQTLKPPYECDFWLLDGQQRLTAIAEYMEGKFPVHGHLYPDLPTGDQRAFRNFTIPQLQARLNDPKQCMEIYERLAYGGTAHSADDQLEFDVRMAYQKALDGDVQGYAAAITDLAEKYRNDRQKLQETMWRVDVDRKVWSRPVAVGETDANGMPYATGLYEFLCNRYGNHFDYGSTGPTENAWETTFFDTAKELYETGVLHDTGNLVRDRKTGKLGFLVNLRLDDNTTIPEATLREIPEQHGVEARLLAQPNDPLGDGTYDPGYVVVAAFIDDINMLHAAPDIAADFMQAEHQPIAASQSNSGPRA